MEKDKSFTKEEMKKMADMSADVFAELIRCDTKTEAIMKTMNCDYETAKKVFAMHVGFKMFESMIKHASCDDGR